ncbi:hypothetical protein U6N30_25310 [Blastococcus brunescens]|uniref:Uncharacterized protein n=1 Tax=Blastococcus brunescens TaxID=1564165 RepID=A0ABZ1AX09_9ACTN|nr:hypothetical protein [Blastococcus sp. BMG 8361]WRL63102.1 hypothetical protein U6N30_25310 [Blastococcus sp. BMG 8361]
MNQLPLIAVRVIRSIFTGASCRNSSTSSRSAARFVERSPSARMSAARGARASSRKSLVATARVSMVCSESKMASRSPASPVTNCCRLTTRSDSCWSRSATVFMTVVRLSIMLPMTASLSARESLSEATCDSRLWTVPPSPWKTWMIS